jgi:hypothetical protein
VAVTLLLGGERLGSRAARSQPATSDDDQPRAVQGAPDLAALERAYHAESDPSRRGHLVEALGGLPGAADLLARIVETDPSDDVALAAAYALRRAALGRVVGLLDRRLDSRKRDSAARDRLLREIERHQVMAAGQNLPHFIRDAPPVFTVPTDRSRDARVLAFGDFGDGSDRQRRMAEAMRRLHAQKPFDLALTLGDNFYPVGMEGPDGPRWDRDFAKLYEPMHVKFFPTLGNHDWALADSPAAEILHSGRSELWRMPAQRYTFVAGEVQYFAIDTNLITRAQLEWLDHEISRSTARWKIVYGHHPVYSHGAHGDEPFVRDSLLPILRGRVNIYLCGHEHDLQHLAPDQGVHFVIAGGGGALPRPITPGPRSLFAASKNGFAVIESNRASLTVRLVGEDLKTLHQFTLR